MTTTELSKFLENFPIPLQHIQPEDYDQSWVFWSGSENSSSSADLGTSTNMIHDKIKSALSNQFHYPLVLTQFWAPVTIGSRRLLSTSGQPFSVNHLSHELAMYRLYSEKYKYNIDGNTVDIEGDHMIRSGGPATAFISHLPSIQDIEGMELEKWSSKLNYKFMLPICFPSQSSCIGVLELTTNNSDFNHVPLVLRMIMKIKEAGLDVFSVKDLIPYKEAGLDMFYLQDLIPYKTINGLKIAKEEIEEAIKVVCESHNLALAQVWITYEDKKYLPSSYSLEDSQTKRLLALNLTGYDHDDDDSFAEFKDYSILCPVIPFSGEELVRKTLQDYESRYISKLRSDMLVRWGDLDYKSSALVICLRSIDTRDFDYAFEFLWVKISNSTTILESILLTLKRCLPSFKFASGAELDDESHVINVTSSTEIETTNFKIFDGKGLPTIRKSFEKGKKPTVKCKTTEISLPREVIESQFGKTMTEAAKNLNVSLATFKRKFKDLDDIPEWPGPNFLKRNANNLSVIQIDTNTVTIKAEYADDIIKFHLPISEATFQTIQQITGTKLMLSVGTFKLKYLDEDREWISLTSQEEMSDCIRTSRKSDGIAVRLRVLASTQPISGPCGS